MCQEERWLSFTPEEVSEAVHLFCKRTDRRTPDARDLAVEIDDLCDRGAGMRLKGTGESFGSLFESELMTALILYCAKRKIPLARRAEKELRRDGERLVLKSVLAHHRTRAAVS